MERISRQYLSMFPVKDMDVETQFPPSLDYYSCSALQTALLSSTVHHTIALEWPVQSQYTLIFLKTLIQKLEANGHEVLEEIYQTFTELMSSKHQQALTTGGQQDYFYRTYTIMMNGGQSITAGVESKTPDNSAGIGSKTPDNSAGIGSKTPDNSAGIGSKIPDNSAGIGFKIPDNSADIGSKTLDNSAGIESKTSDYAASTSSSSFQNVAIVSSTETYSVDICTKPADGTHPINISSENIASIPIAETLTSVPMVSSEKVACNLNPENTSNSLFTTNISSPLYEDSTSLRITLKETSAMVTQGTTGLRTWQASHVLLQHLLQRPHLVEGKRILELGAGVGLAGIGLALSELPRQCRLTDCHDEVLEALRGNVDRNVSQECKVGVKVEELDWLADHDSNSSMDCDIVIGADVVFDPYLYSPLLKTISQALTHQSSICDQKLAVLAVTVRNEEALGNFLSELRSHNLTVQQTITSEYRSAPSLPLDRVRVYYIRLVSV